MDKLNAGHRRGIVLTSLKGSASATVTAVSRVARVTRMLRRLVRACEAVIVRTDSVSCNCLAEQVEEVR